MMSSSGFLFYLDGLGTGGISKVYLVLAEALRKRGVPVGFVLAENRMELTFPEDVWIRVNHDINSGCIGMAHKYVADSALFLKLAVSEFESSFGPVSIVVAGDRVPLIAYRCNHIDIINSMHASRLGVRKLPGLAGYLRQWLRVWRRSPDIRRVLNDKPLHCVSEGLARELTDLFGVRPSMLSVIYNPFDIRAIRQQACLSTPESLAQEKHFIVGVGRFVRSKRFDRLIKAFARCKFDGDLVLIGQGEDENFLRSNIFRFGLQNRVKIVPFHDNHHALVAKAKLLVMTSDTEGLPNVLIESLISGVPVVSLDCKFGPREIVSPFCSRAVVPMDQVESLPVIIDHFIDAPYVISDSYLQRFEVENIADQYLSLAEKIQLMRSSEGFTDPLRGTLNALE